MNYIQSLFGMHCTKFREMNWEGYFQKQNASSTGMEQHTFSQESQARSLISKFNQLCSCSYTSQERWAIGLDSQVKKLPTNTDDLKKLEVVLLSSQTTDYSRVSIIYHRSNGHKTAYFAEIVDGCLKPDSAYLRK